MCDETPVKVRVWFRENEIKLNSYAWNNTVQELEAMKIAGMVIVNDIKYQIKEMVFDTRAEAMIFELEEV